MLIVKYTCINTGKKLLVGLAGVREFCLLLWVRGLWQFAVAACWLSIVLLLYYAIDLMYYYVTNQFATVDPVQNGSALLTVADQFQNWPNIHNSVQSNSNVSNMDEQSKEFHSFLQECLAFPPEASKSPI